MPAPVPTWQAWSSPADPKLQTIVSLLDMDRAHSPPRTPASPYKAAAYEHPSTPSTIRRPLSASASSPREHTSDNPRWHSVEYTRKPLGDPPVTELNPKTASQVIRLKHRASQLIQRYAGTHWQQAQKTKWLLDVVMHIDKDYRSYIMDQASHIQHLQQQIDVQQDSSGAAHQTAQAKIAELESVVLGLQSQLRDACAEVLELRARLGQSQVALTAAEGAAVEAAAEMAELHQAVSVLAEHDARSRKLMANRAHELKEALKSSHAELRHRAEVSRRHGVEVAAMMKLKDDELEAEKVKLVRHFDSQIAAVHDVERAAAQMAVAKVKLELDAYKEPWTYMYGRKSPTKDKELSVALNLVPTSLNTVYVPH